MFLLLLRTRLIKCARQPAAFLLVLNVQPGASGSSWDMHVFPGKPYKCLHFAAPPCLSHRGTLCHCTMRLYPEQSVQRDWLLCQHQRWHKCSDPWVKVPKTSLKHSPMLEAYIQNKRRGMISIYHKGTEASVLKVHLCVYMCACSVCTDCTHNAFRHWLQAAARSFWVRTAAVMDLYN